MKGGVGGKGAKARGAIKGGKQQNPKNAGKGKKQQQHQQKVQQKLNPIKDIQNNERKKLVQAQLQKQRLKSFKRTKSSRGNDGELEDVDDISLAEYRQSEVNTDKRQKDHVYEGGDEYDDFDILNGSSMPVFEYAADDIASMEILGQDQQHLNRGGRKMRTQEDIDEDNENSIANNNNIRKMSKKEKAKQKFDKKIKDAKMIHLKQLPSFKRLFWRDTNRLSAEEQLAIRKKHKIRIEFNEIKTNDYVVSTTEKKTTVIPRPITTFEDRDIPKEMAKFIEFLKIKHKSIREPTPVQMQSWSAVLSGNDVLTIAQTGSGKTLGYLLPTIPHIMAQMRAAKNQQKTAPDGTPIESLSSVKGPIVLVIVPTRELAQQVESVCKPLRTKFGIHSLAVYGGIKAHEQKEILSEEHNEIVIATPGRLVDLIERSHQVAGLLSRVTMLIFDEADRMLQMGFGDQLQKISEQIRPDRQTLMFSATFPKPMQEAAGKWLKRHLKIRVKSSTANQENTSVITKNVKQVVTIVDKAEEKYEHFLKFIKSVNDREQSMRNRSLILVFVNQIRKVEPLQKRLEKSLATDKSKKRPTKIGCMHGDMKQEERDQTIKDFKSGKTTVLISTDILGRGIHINNLRFIINYDFPLSLDQYIHRVGRTGRQGNKGHSVSYFDPTIDKTMATGLVNILKECDQTVKPDLIELASSSQVPQEATPVFTTQENGEEDDDQDEDELDTDDSDFDFDMKDNDENSDDEDDGDVQFEDAEDDDEDEYEEEDEEEDDE
ncbi:hypothetical protein PPL_02356 [Heterostelium album PN500]|uniref:RNA helicase n=1 Tax=Heterostelium pallidum (strain ATCC 26659 / Pp 5 / PN500) TaxID=670386 RepID=D3B229_HETP5|nr:hypothetical protein PPL_02356 [Heterostelium album PN500]EFA85353.1 hypothetical protein PPL_02356 [Heterostelium album PN500]|eukprot:XP_020437462.1 hypothetical protein PPL_02356 [Heterostelium album PN500]